jgi:hypothetical protein
MLFGGVMLVLYAILAFPTSASPTTQPTTSPTTSPATLPATLPVH